MPFRVGILAASAVIVLAAPARASGPITMASLIPGATPILPSTPGTSAVPSPGLPPAAAPRAKPVRQAQAQPAAPAPAAPAAPPAPPAQAPAPSPTGPIPAAQAAARAAGSPPPPRELTPAEITALQGIMADRARGAVLSPGNADAIRDRVLDAQRNALQSGYGTAAPQPRPRMMVVDPQVLLSTPQGLQLALGVVTPITFLDDRGRPWPVESVAFDPRMFAQDGSGCGAGGGGVAVMAMGERPSTINIMPCRLTTWGNISVKLQDYPLPVVLMARSGSGTAAVDLPVTVRVQGRSPNAPALPYDAMAAYVPPPVRTAAPPPRQRAGRRDRGAAVENGRMVPDRLLDAFGAGAPPKDAERVAVDDPSVSAWTLDGRLYLRGAVTVINPAHDAEGESFGGMKVWRFDHPVPRVYVVDRTGAERALTMQF